MCPFVLFHVVITLFVLITDSDYPFGILKLFLHLLMLSPIVKIQWNSIYFVFNNYFCGRHSHMSLCTNINNWFLPTYVIIVFCVLSFEVGLSSEFYFFKSSYITSIDILPRTKSTIQALPPFFQGFLYILINLTCNVWAIASLFVFVGRNQHFHHFTIAKELPTNSD